MQRVTIYQSVKQYWTSAAESGYAPVTANLELAALAMDDGEYKVAEDFSSAALQSDMSSVSAWATLANSLSRRGGSEQARQVLEKSLEHVSDDGRISLALGNATVNSDPEAAIKHFEKAVELSPSMSEAWNNLGKAYEARASLLTAQRVLGNQPDVVQRVKALDELIRKNTKKESLVWCVSYSN